MHHKKTAQQKAVRQQDWNTARPKLANAQACKQTLHSATTLRDRLVPETMRRPCRTIPRVREGVIRGTSTKEHGKNAIPHWENINEHFGGNFDRNSAWLIKWQAHIFSFLRSDEADTLERAYPYLDRKYGETTIAPPMTTLRRQRHGFGRDTGTINCTHTTPSPYLLIHYAWEFLSTNEKKTLGEKTSVYFDTYASMRQKAMTEDISAVRVERETATEADLKKPVDKCRAYHLAIALMRFDYTYAHLIRWLGGTYTYQHRDFQAVFDLVDLARKHPIPDGFPPVDYDRAEKMFTIGAPIAAEYDSSFESTQMRERYDNHPPLSDVAEEVRQKLNKEERLSYYVMLPRSVWGFIPGLGISPMTYVQRPGSEGRICLDPTTILPTVITADGTSQKDDGAPNSQLPDTGTKGAEDTNPKVHYADAFYRFMKWIWRMRIRHPRTEILLTFDDIAAAFHRLLYHPAMAPAYSMVFEEYLAIPTGVVFGAKNSPSLYMIPAELRAHITAVLTEVDSFITDLADGIQLPAPMTDEEKNTITQAVPDGCHQAITSAEARPPSFVDDSGIAGIPAEIKTMINRSIISAYLTFGFPDESNNTAVINPKKFPIFIWHYLKFLGYLIVSRAMTVEWPKEKRRELAEMLDEYWLNPSPQRPKLTPSISSRPLGLIRHGAMVANLGVYHSLRLQHQLNDMHRVDQSKIPLTIKNGASNKIGTRRWWKNSDMPYDNEAIAELSILRPTLDNFKWDHVWKRPIGLIVKRTPTLVTEGDASYTGLGGFGKTAGFMWRLSKQDLEVVGIPMFKKEPRPGELTGTGTHINELEFMALIISIYLALALAPPNSQPILLATGDNTSALSWLSYAARTKKPTVRRLARLMQAMLTYYPYHFALQNEHVKGVNNDTADILSRFTRAPTWASVIELTSPILDNCRPYRVPSELLSLLHKAVTSEQTGDWYVKRMTKLWTVKPVTLPTGWLLADTMTSL